MGFIVILHLGVIEAPYTNEKEGVSTGDVAEFLEAKYDVMQHFADLHLDEIGVSLEASVCESIKALLQGAPVTSNPYNQMTEDVRQMFNTYLDNEEIDEIGVAGVPTQAALNGVRTALKKKKEIKNIKTYRSKTRGTRRPSFIDTGLYRNTFRAWVE